MLSLASAWDRDLDSDDGRVSLDHYFGLGARSNFGVGPPDAPATEAPVMAVGREHPGVIQGEAMGDLREIVTIKVLDNGVALG